MTCQIRTYGRGYPTGVALLLLSPPARSERVWLYAAELAERLLPPNIPIPTRCIQDRMPISLALVGPQFGRPPAPNTRPCAEQRANQPGATPNRLRAKLNAGFHHGPGELSSKPSAQKLGK